jgi:phage baseplate assembly protein V
MITFDSLVSMVRGLVMKAVVVAVNDAVATQSMQLVIGQDDPLNDVAHFQGYGFAVNPHPGAEAVVVNVGGLNHPIVVAVEDRRYRLKGLASGEVALYDDQDQVVKIGRNKITIESTGANDVEVIAGGKILLGGATGLPAEKIVTGTSVQAGAAGLTVADNAYAKV